MIPSEEFSLGHTGCETAEDAAKKLYETYNPEVVVITQGKKGGIIYDGIEIISYPIYPAVVVDSNGSGDVFHGAFAADSTAAAGPGNGESSPLQCRIQRQRSLECEFMGLSVPDDGQLCHNFTPSAAQYQNR